jgi:hypothetical protein
VEINFCRPNAVSLVDPAGAHVVSAKLQNLRLTRCESNGERFTKIRIFIILDVLSLSHVSEPFPALVVEHAHHGVDGLSSLPYAATRQTPALDADVVVTQLNRR